jgi:signal recognition particle receptor subunit beta
MASKSDLTTYWVVIAGLQGSGKTTFLRHAADTITIRDQQDMSLITEADTERVLRWLERTGGTLAPHSLFQTEEEILFQRWSRRVTVGEIIVGPDLRAALYEAPGTRDFTFLWQIMTPETYLGTIMLIDSTAHDSIRDASRIASTFAAYAPEPYVFAANKQDRAAALPVDDIRTVLHFVEGHKAPVVPCTAHDVWSVKRTLIRLLELIRDTYDDGIQW